MPDKSKSFAIRHESDFLGTVDIPFDALYGIYSFRAQNNFSINQPFNQNWFKAMAKVKLSCYLTYNKFKQASLSKYKAEQIPFSLMEDETIHALIQASNELIEGQHYLHFIVPAIQGGAGTSINMNINEIIANRALQILKQIQGNYSLVDPINHANIYQSTNDVVPTALRVASMEQLSILENAINATRNSLEALETDNRNVLRAGYTQMQEAVPSSFGLFFGAYNNAFGRDWWRVSKCFERIKEVNLGGSAIGTGITVPRFFVMQVVQELQQLTGLPLARSENMCDATSNLDAFVEIHGILKAHAVNIEKLASDLRLLASDIAGIKSLSLAPRQTGSSIMPGKVNPVISEYLISISHIIYANDQIITSLSAQGQLELNAYIPVIGHYLLQSIDLLIKANTSISQLLLKDLIINESVSISHLYSSPVITTALIPLIGYHKSAELAKYMKANNCDVYKANTALKIMDIHKIEKLLHPSELLKTGFSLQDIVD